MENLGERLATIANGTMTGAIVACAMGVPSNADTWPRYVGHASVTSDGFVMCDFIDRDGRLHHGAFIGAYSDLERNVNALAMHAGLSGDETRQMWHAINMWIAADYRHLDSAPLRELRKQVTGRISADNPAIKEQTE